MNQASTVISYKLRFTIINIFSNNNKEVTIVDMNMSNNYENE